MLALTRGVNESIFIKDANDIIRIMVTRIQGKRVRLGVDAPPEVKIYREELLPKIYGNSMPPKIELPPETRLSQLLIDNAKAGDLEALNLLHQIGLQALNEGRIEFAKTLLCMAYDNAIKQ